MDKFITFNNVCDLLKRATRITESSEVYDELQDVMKLEVTGYNVDRIKELVLQHENTPQN